MAVKFNPSSIGSGLGYATQINQLFSDVQSALQDAVSRTGNGPNAMSADLDLGTNDLLNVGTANISKLLVDGNELASLTEMQTLTSDAQDAATEAENWAQYAEDSLVPEGDGATEYSAYHWAQKAAEDAAAVNLPSITTGDADKMLRVNDAEDGYELANGLPDPVAGDNNKIAAVNTAEDGYELKTAGEVAEYLRATTAQAEAGTNNDTVMTPLRAQEHYDAQISSASVALGGDFTGVGAFCQKIGNTVTITVEAPIDHDVMSDPSSSSGAIPSEFRPTNLVTNVIGANTNYITYMTISAGGQLSLEHRDWTGALDSRQTFPGSGCISYVVTDEV